MVPSTIASPAPPHTSSWCGRFRETRDFTTALCESLEVDDLGVQSMPDASPVKWHLAHTTWFFETFVLAAAEPGVPPFDPRWGFLFNSYYEGVGPRHERPRRGLLTRPTLPEVRAYRDHVDGRIRELLAGDRLAGDALAVVEVGLHHEQQHQELILTDVLHLLSCNPLEPALVPGGMRFQTRPGASGPRSTWTEFDGGLHEIGHAGDGFAFDNESPRHRVFLEPFRLANQPVTNREYLAFLEDGGYRRPEFWLSDGWGTVQAEGWSSPLYWGLDGDGGWTEFTVSGRVPLDPDRPACHLSGYEADAYARWAGARLPTEAEWEVAAASLPVEDAIARGGFAESREWHPRPASPGDNRLGQMLGDVWEWTASPYAPYPGFRPLPGTLGEYNGKFMCNQLVLRGGSCATPRSHIRTTYRNFFPPHARWQFSGLRLAWDRV